MTRAPHRQVPVAVISGGSSGIGLECARSLLKRGYIVALLARDLARLKASADLLEKEFPLRVWIGQLDVNDSQNCTAIIEKIASEYGRIDWLITSAGIAEPAMFDSTSLDSHRRQMDTNYFGTLHLVQPVVEIMKRSGGGRITMISSAAAFIGIAGYSGYSPSKFAIRALSDILRVELAPEGIFVSVAFPPDTDTPQLAHENITKPAATRKITAGGGVLSARTVAESMISQAESGRFMLTPSVLIFLYGWLHSVYAPLFRYRQARILAQESHLAQNESSLAERIKRIINWS